MAVPTPIVKLAEPVWQDREIRFDLPIRQLLPRRGEVQIDSINSVEDTKGNNGERGALTVTNLRITWASHRNPATNLSIGYNCVVSINIRSANSRLRGTTQALYIMTKYNHSRFEFIFTSLVRASPRLFTTVQSVFRAYETTKLYRDLKLRGAIIKDKQLLLLPHEQVYNKLSGVWNLSTDQGNLGTFFVTNVRLVWHAHLAENFNVSVPYLQMKSVRLRASKFGLALVIETTPASGGYILGFRMDTDERLQRVFEEISSLHKVFSVNPIFGIEFHEEETPTAAPAPAPAPPVEDVAVVEEEEGDAFAAYYAAAAKDRDRPPVYSLELGLAVEALPEGTTMEKLWAIVS